MSVTILSTNQRFVFIGTQAEIEALTGLEEGAQGYATDRSANEHEGVYNGASWEWFTGGTAIPNNGWILISATWTRTSNHAFTTPGDVTATYRKGTKVRYKDGVSNEYGVVFSSSHAAGTTTVTLFTNTDYAMAAATITDTYISYIENPEGFPAEFNYVPSFNNFTANNATIFGKFEVNGRKIKQKAGFIFGSTPSVITGTLNLVPIATPLALGTTQEYFGATTIRDTGTALFEGTVYLIGGNLYPQVSATGGAYAAPANVTATVPMTWVSTDEISMICEYTF